MKTRVIRRAEVKTQHKDWGTLRWNLGGTAFQDINQTFGIVTIKPGQANPMHSHPNCDEVLYVIRGRLEHTLPEGGMVSLETGDSIILPRGKAHQARNSGQEEAVAAVLFNTWDRQVENE